MMRRLLAALVLALAPGLAQAEDVPATLIADQIRVEGDSRLVATGHIEVFYNDYTLKAARIEYDRKGDLLTIEGPLSIVTGDGKLLLADSAELAPDLTAGILRSARLVLERELQLASNELHRVDGRFSVLTQTVVSSCQVCGDGPPLWQIRASRVVHDEDRQMLFFDNARFEIAGVPVLYVPRLRLPDPTLDRASGFLTPTVRVTDDLGTSLKVPYFLTLGDHADLTVTPYLSSGKTNTAEFRFRRAFRTGEIELNGAASRDDLEPGNRAYLFAEGHFELPHGFDLDFNLRTVSDDAYLTDYGFSDDDRLASPIRISRTRKDEDIQGGLTLYKTLRSNEPEDTLPNQVADVSWSRRFRPGFSGGVVEVNLDAFSFNRRSTADVTGRDLRRVSAGLTWFDGLTTGNGIVWGTTAAVRGDFYRFRDDAALGDPEFRLSGGVATELRWPHARTDASGAVQVLEPIVQLAWTEANNSNIPNEDSRSVEFDEGNLFSLNRFPGSDAVEEGLRANIGLSWTRDDPAGWSLQLAGGRVYRADGNTQFSAGTGLDGLQSDWLVAGRLDLGGNMALINRAVFDDNLDFTRNEFRADWSNDKLDLAGTYLWQEKNATESRPNSISELKFDGAYRMAYHWTGRMDWRYDFVSSRTTRTGVGIEYRNECVAIDLSLSRRFASSTSVRSTTDFGLTVTLAGFGNGSGGAVPRRTCAAY